VEKILFSGDESAKDMISNTELAQVANHFTRYNLKMLYNCHSRDTKELIVAP